jgi:FkbM family methyltransferase
MPSLLRKIRRSLAGLRPAPEQLLQVGPVPIALPPGHMLPVYQKQHPRYDRFLPHLARLLEPGAGVIDVGANCGDTLAAMAAANPALRYLCIEPDAGFMAYLERNLKALRTTWPQLAVHTAQALVGLAVSGVALEGSGGTKHAKPGAGGMAATTLDALLAQSGFGPVRLLKSDVDGYDHDVIASAPELLARDAPMLFFECHFADAAQRGAYERSVDALAQSGYRHWTVFDNFGEVLLASARPEQMAQLFEYVERQNRGRSTRTIFYFDVLVATERDAGFAAQAVRSY